jgi:Xaa-Pro aminopeptidase
MYFPGRFGVRLEDIVVATPDGPARLNNAARDIAVVA